MIVSLDLGLRLQGVVALSGACILYISGAQDVVHMRRDSVSVLVYVVFSCRFFKFLQPYNRYLNCTAALVPPLDLMLSRTKHHHLSNGEHRTMVQSIDHAITVPWLKHGQTLLSGTISASFRLRGSGILTSVGPKLHMREARRYISPLPCASYLLCSPRYCIRELRV